MTGFDVLQYVVGFVIGVGIVSVLVVMLLTLTSKEIK